MLRQLKHRLRHLGFLLQRQNRSQFAELRREIAAAGRPVLVLGSAPDSQLPGGWDQANPLITINAAQSIATQLGLGAPTIAVITATLLGELESNVAAKAQLRGKSTETLFFIERMFSWKMCRKLFEHMDYRFRRVLIASHEERNHIMHQMLGENLGIGKNAGERVSNGIFAILLALYLGYPAIVIAGINPNSNGHAYDSKNLKREHSDPDAYALRLIATQHKNVYAAAPELAANFGLPLWHG